VTVVLEVYDLLDVDLPKVTKLWAQNSALGRLICSNRKYWSDPYRVVRDTNWGSADAALKDLFNDAHGFDPFPAVGVWTETERRCFWISKNRRRFYRSAFEHTQVQLSNIGDGGRNGVGVGAPGPINGASAGLWAWNAGGLGAPSLLMVSPDGLVYLHTSGGSGTFDNQVMQQLNGWSLLHGIPLINSPAASQYAILLKPLSGVDLFFTNWLDVASYRVEAVGGEGRFGHQGLRILPTPVGNDRDAEGNVMGSWTLSDFIQAAGRSWPSTLHGHGARPGPIRFQVRDLATNRVSELSSPQVTFGRRRRWAEMPVLVVNHNS